MSRVIPGARCCIVILFRTRVEPWGGPARRTDKNSRAWSSKLQGIVKNRTAQLYRTSLKLYRALQDHIQSGENRCRVRLCVHGVSNLIPGARTGRSLLLVCAWSTREYLWSFSSKPKIPADTGDLMYTWVVAFSYRGVRPRSFEDSFINEIWADGSEQAKI